MNRRNFLTGAMIGSVVGGGGVYISVANRPHMMQWANTEKEQNPGFVMSKRSPITDWNDAYDNFGHIENAKEYPAKWASLAKEFRQQMSSLGRAQLDVSYGDAERERLDLFHPKGVTKGLAVFAHGGFWKAFDKSSWSHLAAGALARGWAVCIPSYTLAPQARISQITQQFATAIESCANLVKGPLRLSGHSAGGHLVARMMCEDSPLSANYRTRVEHVVSISGVHDLRPLLLTRMNEVLGLDEAQAIGESVALNRPLSQCSITCWVGEDERPAFILQNDLLANIWAGLGARTASVYAVDKHHFNVIEDLIDPSSDLTNTWVG